MQRDKQPPLLRADRSYLVDSRLIPCGGLDESSTRLNLSG
jgi:hypothetical protein